MNDGIDLAPLWHRWHSLAADGPARDTGSNVLAAPIVLDLASFMDLAQRARQKGIQKWLSFYFKRPQTAPGLHPEHDRFI